MLQHEIECLLTSPLTEVGQQSDVSSNQRLQARSDRSKDGARAHNDASNHAQGARYAEAIQFALRGDHVVGDHPASVITSCHERLPESVSSSACFSGLIAKYNPGVS